MKNLERLKRDLESISIPYSNIKLFTWYYLCVEESLDGAIVYFTIQGNYLAAVHDVGVISVVPTHLLLGWRFHGVELGPI